MGLINQLDDATCGLDVNGVREGGGLSEGLIHSCSVILSVRAWSLQRHLSVVHRILDMKQNKKRGNKNSAQVQYIKDICSMIFGTGTQVILH